MKLKPNFLKDHLEHLKECFPLLYFTASATRYFEYPVEDRVHEFNDYTIEFWNWDDEIAYTHFVISADETDIMIWEVCKGYYDLRYIINVEHHIQTVILMKLASTIEFVNTLQ